VVSFRVLNLKNIFKMSTYRSLYHLEKSAFIIFLVIDIVVILNLFCKIA